MTDWTKKWDDHEKRMDESDINEPKVEIQVNTEKNQQDEEELPTFSGIFCIYCQGHAIYIYEGMSICNECFNKETADLIKERRKKQ